MFYSGIYNPSVGYCLPLTYFTKAELKAIQRPAHRAMLSRLGFNCNTAQPVVFAPRDRGCFELHHMYDGQGFGQASFLLKSWRSQKTLQGRMIRIGVHWAQYTSGIGIPILEAPVLELPHLES